MMDLCRVSFITEKLSNKIYIILIRHTTDKVPIVEEHQGSMDNCCTLFPQPCYGYITVHTVVVGRIILCSVKLSIFNFKNRFYSVCMS